MNIAYTPATRHRLAELPIEATVKAVDVYEDADLPLGVAGVIVECDTGHMLHFLQPLGTASLDEAMRETVELAYSQMVARAQQERKVAPHV